MLCVCISFASIVDMIFTGYVQLITSLLNIFYSTAQFPQQVRLLRPEDAQIKFFSMATAALLIWRTLIVGSRILVFVLFACIFRHWLFVLIGVHYSLMFVMVSYQMSFMKKKELIRHVVYVFVTPFVYIFDFCINWLDGPTRYWYVMCYVPMFCENVLMSGLVLWYSSTMPSLAWYIVPGCVGVIAMFPLGILVQLAYYRYWHPVRRPHAELQPTQQRFFSWSRFRKEVEDAQQQTPAG